MKSLNTTLSDHGLTLLLLHFDRSEHISTRSIYILFLHSQAANEKWAAGIDIASTDTAPVPQIECHHQWTHHSLHRPCDPSQTGFRMQPTRLGSTDADGYTSWQYPNGKRRLCSYPDPATVARVCTRWGSTTALWAKNSWRSWYMKQRRSNTAWTTLCWWTRSYLPLDLTMGLSITPNTRLDVWSWGSSLTY